MEEWKWRGVPVWSRGGILCTGETYKDKVKLTFPKGSIEPGESLVAAAKREMFEEAGLRGKVKRKSRPLCYMATSKDIEPVLYFLFRITDEASSWPEKDVRRRVFTPLEGMQSLPLGDAPRTLLKQLYRVSRFTRTTDGKNVKLKKTA